MQKQTKPDYTELLALLNEQQELVLTDGMNLSTEAAQQLEVVIDGALGHTFAALPRGTAIEIVNREETFRQQLPFVSLRVGKGVISLGAVHLHLLSFREVQERLAAEAEAFKLYLMSREIPQWSSYLYNLQLWQQVDPKLIREFRTWMPTCYPADEQPEKLKAVAMYCRLAQADGILDADELDALIDAIDKPLPARKRRA